MAIGLVAVFVQITNSIVSVIKVHSFLVQRLVDSGSISKIAAQLRSLFQVGLQYVLRVSEYIFEESVLCIAGNG